MQYIYDLCPKCKDKLVERMAEDPPGHKGIYCPNCGSKMNTVLLGEKKAEKVMYKITLSQMRSINDKVEKYLKAIKQIGNCGEDETLEKRNADGGISFEGNLLNTYLRLELLDEIDDIIDYAITPSFPYKRLVIQKCPDCGEEAVYKEVEISGNEIQRGFFCEKCNDWIWYDVCSKLQMDETLYYLKVFLRNTRDKEKQEIMGIVDKLQDKEVLEDQIAVRDLARNVENLLGRLKEYGIYYEINPPYPYKITAYKKELTEDDIKQLIAANPGLKVTAEELNALIDK